MYGVTSALGTNSEANLRPQNPDVLLRQRTHERMRMSGLEGGSGQGGDGGDDVPGRYMVLVSRVDRAQQQARVDRAQQQARVERPLVDQLTSLLGERIAGLSPATRRTLEELPEVRALGVENLLQLPRVIAAHLHAGTQREAVMALLRSPSFAAAIRDQARTTTYGPHGLLRAS